MKNIIYSLKNYYGVSLIERYREVFLLEDREVILIEDRQVFLIEVREVSLIEEREVSHIEDYKVISYRRPCGSERSILEYPEFLSLGHIYLK